MTKFQIGIPVEIDDKTMLIKIVDLTEHVTALWWGNGPRQELRPKQESVVVDGVARPAPLRLEGQ